MEKYLLNERKLFLGDAPMIMGRRIIGHPRYAEYFDP